MVMCTLDYCPVCEVGRLDAMARHPSGTGSMREVVRLARWPWVLLGMALGMLVADGLASLTEGRRRQSR